MWNDSTAKTFVFDVSAPRHGVKQKNDFTFIFQVHNEHFITQNTDHHIYTVMLRKIGQLVG
jgi:hypothetical protein